MAGLSIYDDGPILDSLRGLCGLPTFGPTSPEGMDTDTEVALRNLFDQIMNDLSAVKNPTQGMVLSGLGFELPSGSSRDTICVGYSDVLSRLIQKFYKGGGAEDSSYEKIEGLVYRILNEKIAKFQSGDVSYWNGRQLMNSCDLSGSLKRKCESLPDILMWIKGVATDPCDLRTSGTLQEWRKWRNLILRTRKVLFLRITENLNMEEFPYRKKQKIHQFLCGTSRDIACSVPSLLNQNNSISRSKLAHEMLNQKKRRSQRSLGLLKFNESHLPRKRIPVGPFFQADVPNWTDPSNDRLVSGNNEHLNDLRWLGTQIWPIEGHNQETSLEMIGKGRPILCFCLSPGSVACNRLHVSMARFRMKTDMGRAFSSLGFDDMGEEVSQSWAFEEQMNFGMLVKLNPMSENKSFWAPALKFFASKSRQDLASYYFNVFALRRMSIQTRLASGEVDSDDDESYVNAQATILSQKVF